MDVRCQNLQKGGTSTSIKNINLFASGSEIKNPEVNIKKHKQQTVATANINLSEVPETTSTFPIITKDDSKDEMEYTDEGTSPNNTVIGRIQGRKPSLTKKTRIVKKATKESA